MPGEKERERERERDQKETAGIIFPAMAARSRLEAARTVPTTAAPSGEIPRADGFPPTSGRRAGSLRSLLHVTPAAGSGARVLITLARKRCLSSDSYPAGCLRGADPCLSTPESH